MILYFCLRTRGLVHAAGSGFRQARLWGEGRPRIPCGYDVKTTMTNGRCADGSGFDRVSTSSTTCFDKLNHLFRQAQPPAQPNGFGMGEAVCFETPCGRSTTRAAGCGFRRKCPQGGERTLSPRPNTAGQAQSRAGTDGWRRWKSVSGWVKANSKQDAKNADEYRKAQTLHRAAFPGTARH